MPRSSTKTTTKKTTKKAAPKKTTKKAVKRTVKKVSHDKGVMVCAAGAECFWVNDGQVLKNLEELATALSEMHKKVFAHHVSKEKNDFADWVEFVLHDQSCASDLRSSKTPSSAAKIIARHVRLYS